MKFTLKNTALAAVAAVTLIATPVAAAGRIEGGDIYWIKNVTQNSAFVDPANAKPCDTLTYKVRIHNGGPDAINNVNVKATLPAAAATTNSSVISITSADVASSPRTDTATLKLSSAQSVKYVTGSTKLLDANQGLVTALPDGITGAGITVPSVGVSTNNIRYVQFDAKVDCPVTPNQPKTPETPATPAEQPATLPETGGPAAGLAAVAGSGVLGYAVMAYRRSKRALADKLLNR